MLQALTQVVGSIVLSGCTTTGCIQISGCWTMTFPRNQDCCCCILPSGQTTDWSIQLTAGLWQLIKPLIKPLLLVKHTHWPITLHHHVMSTSIIMCCRVINPLLGWQSACTDEHPPISRNCTCVHFYVIAWEHVCFTSYCSMIYNVVACRFYVETIGLLRDIQTVELFYFNARQAIFKVSFH